MIRICELTSVFLCNLWVGLEVVYFTEATECSALALKRDEKALQFLSPEDKQEQKKISEIATNTIHMYCAKDNPTYSLHASQRRLTSPLVTLRVAFEICNRFRVMRLDLSFRMCQSM
jgi:hypothetical protein